MPILGRSIDITIRENGDIFGVLVSNLDRGIAPFTLYDQEKPTISVQRSFKTGGLESTSYGAGCRILTSHCTCQGDVINNNIPVIALDPESTKSSSPLRGTLIEAACDPQLSYDAVNQRFELFYWVNAWSPSGLESKPQSLFLCQVSDYSYKSEAGYFDINPEYSPDKSKTTQIRDIPEWFDLDLKPTPIESPYGIPEPENIAMGNFNPSNFWVAPWSDAFLYRFPESIDKTPEPSTNQINIPSSPPLPPPITPDESGSLLRSGYYTNTPYRDLQIYTEQVLGKANRGEQLRPSEKATLTEYLLGIRRLAYLCRTTRVLMRSTGNLWSLKRVDGEDQARQTSGPALPQPLSVEDYGNQTHYLVVSQPEPVYYLPRNVNKVMAGRQKWSSYISGEEVFITAPLNYKYPGAASLTTAFSDPQVDFTIHDPSTYLEALYMGGVLPQADEPQQSSYAPQRDLGGYGGSPTSLVGLMQTPSAWQSY